MWLALRRAGPRAACPPPITVAIPARATTRSPFRADRSKNCPPAHIASLCGVGAFYSLRSVFESAIRGFSIVSPGFRIVEGKSFPVGRIWIVLGSPDKTKTRAVLCHTRRVAWIEPLGGNWQVVKADRPGWVVSISYFHAAAGGFAHGGGVVLICRMDCSTKLCVSGLRFARCARDLVRRS